MSTARVDRFEDGVWHFVERVCAAVGALVGVSLGAAEGIDVGTAVGLAEGAELGELLGAEVQIVNFGDASVDGSFGKVAKLYPDGKVGVRLVDGRDLKLKSSKYLRPFNPTADNGAYCT